MISHRDALGFVKEKFGSDGFETLLRAMTEEDRRIATVDSSLINNWVDVDVHVRLLSLVVDELARKNEKILLEMGEWIATAQLRGVYRVFLVVVSPAFMLKRASVIFHTFYDEGAMEVVTVGPGKVDCTFRGFQAQQRLIELSITGWFAGAAKLSRAKNNRVEITTSLAEGNDHFRVLFTYTE